MAKRFTATEKWQDLWYRKLSPKLKSFWQYMCDNCDNAGVWKVDFELASFYIGEAITQEDINTINQGKERVILANDHYFVIRDFIPYQIGDINSKDLTNLQKNCISLLNQYVMKGIDILKMVNFTGSLPVVYGYKHKGKGKGKDNSINTSKSYNTSNTVANENSSFGKYETLFFGEAPKDLIGLAANLQPLEKAQEWQDYVKEEIEKIGYQVEKEVWCKLPNNKNGKIDLVARKEKLEVAIECDYRTPREKSILKIKTYPCGMILLRNPKVVKRDFEEFEGKFLAAWNNLCLKFPILPKIQEITGTRRAHLKKRYEKASFREFPKILEAIETQQFLLGENDRKWVISFDWLIRNDTNYLKVLEKKYFKPKPSVIEKYLRKD